MPFASLPSQRRASPACPSSRVSLRPARSNTNSSAAFGVTPWSANRMRPAPSETAETVPRASFAAEPPGPRLELTVMSAMIASAPPLGVVTPNLTLNICPTVLAGGVHEKGHALLKVVGVVGQRIGLRVGVGERVAARARRGAEFLPVAGRPV